MAAVAAGRDRDWSDFHPGDYPMTAASLPTCYVTTTKPLPKKPKDDKM